MKSFFQGIGCLIYGAMGLLQLAAILGGLEEWLGLHWLLATPLALILAYIPLVGSIIGIVAATTLWHWHWLVAVLLFGWQWVFFAFVRQGDTR